MQMALNTLATNIFAASAWPPTSLQLLHGHQHLCKPLHGHQHLCWPVHGLHQPCSYRLAASKALKKL
jgi:hypothetical protein